MSMRLLPAISLPLLAAGLLFHSARADSVSVAAQTAPPSAKVAAPPADPADAAPDTLLAAAAAGNYAFATTTVAALEDMSSDTSVLIGPAEDDVASALTPIGFDFYFMGARRTGFSVSSNGAIRLDAVVQRDRFDILGRPNQALIGAYIADQRTHAGDGVVHYKLAGSAPQRRLVIEWRNMSANFHAAGTADLTYQVQLHETSGVVEFVYGAMNMSAAGSADPNSSTPEIGISSSSTAGTVGSIAAPQSGAPSPSYNGSATVPASNFYNPGPISVLSSAADGARRAFTLTPPAVAPPGGPLTFSAIATTAMTLHWTDSVNETGYEIHVSTDGGASYTFVANLPGDTTSYNASGLFAATAYTWRVRAYSEGTLAAISGTQLTAMPTPNSAAASGLWSAASTWSAGHVPTSGESVTIAAGATVTIDTDAVAHSIDIAGTLQFEQIVGHDLSVGSDITVRSGATLQSNPAGEQNRHRILLAGSLVNDGTLDLSTHDNLAAATLLFNGPNPASFSGSGATTDIHRIELVKGSAVVELRPTNFSVSGSSGDTDRAWLALTSGVLRLSGTFSGSHRVVEGQFPVPPSAGLWLDNPNYSVVGQPVSMILSGLLRVSQGTFNAGVDGRHDITVTRLVVDGGAVNVAGGLYHNGNIIFFDQSGGTITTCTVPDPQPHTCFNMGSNPSSRVDISGGSIVIQNSQSTCDYDNRTGSGIAGMTGGTLQLGNAASGAAQTFGLCGVMPNLLISNTSAAHSAKVDELTGGAISASRDITINPGTTLDIGDDVFLMAGNTLTNNGTLTANGANSEFIWHGAGQGAQTYAGGGIVSAAVSAMSVRNDSSLTLAAAAGITVNRLNLISGDVINANRLTLGSGGTAPVIVQVGDTVPSTPGSFDVAPNFNLGSGGQQVSYLLMTDSRSTGLEINPGRQLTRLEYADADPAHVLNLAGGDLTVTEALQLHRGRIVTGAHTLIVAPGADVERTTGHVDGRLRKTFSETALQTFEVGTANGYSPLQFSAGSGSFPAAVTVAAVQGSAPGVASAANVIGRYWTVDASGLSATLYFLYRDPPDIPGTLDEASLRVLQRGTLNPSDYRDIGGDISTAGNVATVADVDTFSTFTLGLAAADLAISVDDSASSVAAGGTLNYRIVASNAGAVGNPAVRVSDTFPPSLSCSTTCAGSNGGGCTPGPLAGALDDTASLPAGASVTYTAVCQVSPTASGAIINTAQIAGNGVADNNPANNSASDTTTAVKVQLAAVLDDDGQGYVRYGQLRNFRLRITNTGQDTAAGVGLNQTLSSDYTAAAATWLCSGAGAGASCTASGSGALSDSAVVIPPARTLTWLISVPVAANAPHASADSTIQVTAPLDLGAPYTLNDSDILVVFRDGYEPAPTLPPLPPEESRYTALPQLLSPGGSIALRVPQTAAARIVETLWRTRASDGSSLRLERADLDGVPWLRLVTRDPFGGEQPGAWLAAAYGSTAVVTLADEEERAVAILATAAGEARLPLATGLPQQSYPVESKVEVQIGR